MFSSVTCGRVNISGNGEEEEVVEEDAVKEEKQRLGSPARSTTAICSAAPSQPPLPLPLPLSLAIQLQRSETRSGPVISVYCMQNQQA